MGEGVEAEGTMVEGITGAIMVDTPVDTPADTPAETAETAETSTESSPQGLSASVQALLPTPSSAEDNKTLCCAKENDQFWVYCIPEYRNFGFWPNSVN